MRRLYNLNKSEPNMRQELINTFAGKFPEEAKAQSGAIRRMRREDNGSLIECPCIDEVTKEPDVDKFCPICWGEGFIWDEMLLNIYKVIIRSSVGLATKEDVIEPGLVNIPMVSFFATYDLDVDKQDKIIELVLNKDGTPLIPYKRERLYRIGTAIDFRADNAKLEYWKLDCYEEQRKFLNGVTNNGDC